MIKPIRDRIVVKPKEAKNETSGGIIIPGSAKEKPQKGTVIAVGKGKVENGTKIEMTVQEDDEILYGKYSGTEVMFEGEEYIMMRESDVLGVI